MVRLKAFLRLLITLMRMRIRIFPSMRIRTRILLRIKLMQICDHWHTDSQRLNFEYDFAEDPAPPFHFNADPDPASLIDPVDPDPPHCLKVYSTFISESAFRNEWSGDPFINPFYNPLKQTFTHRKSFICTISAVIY